MKSRREFLRDTPLLLLGAFSGCCAGALPGWAGTSSPPRPRASRRATGFAQLNFITADPHYSDYRPAIDSAAQHVVFERTPAAGGNTSLYIIAMGSALVAPFVQSGQGGLFTGPSQTRPDWSWVTDKVVMNVAASNNDELQVLITDSDGNPLQNVHDSRGFVYPTWTPDGTQLIIYNNSSDASPAPCTSLVDLDGSVRIPNLNGNDANNVPMFGGFASPMPQNKRLIAYAGQPDMAWGPAAVNGGYNQNFNYVFLNAERNATYGSAPLEPAASIRYFEPSYQGRAPVWSPDGNYIAFESDRAGGYAIFLANVAQGTAPVQLTDAQYGSQHAKFFPDGTRIVLTALQQPGGGPRGIAWADISEYL